MTKPFSPLSRRMLLGALPAAGVVTSLAGSVAGQSQGPLRGTVSEGIVQPLSIAIMIAGTEPSGNNIGEQITKVIIADLQSSGYFAPIDPRAFIQTSLDVNLSPAWENWSAVNAQFLANGRAYINANGQIQADVHLWDIYSQKEVQLSTNPNNPGIGFANNPVEWRRVAHKHADLIYERLTGEKGYFDTRIAFVAESGKRGARVKRLAMMDQDGANPQYLPVEGSGKIITPRFSADGNEIAYMALSADSARIFLYNVRAQRGEQVGQVRGMAFAPRYSPDGSKLAFSVSQGANSDIYVMNLNTRAASRLTSDPAIDTSPSFSPDGSRIAFTSDRGGSPQIYVMGADGSGARRITFGGGLYSTPVFSPKGDLIAFTKQSKGRFSIGVMNPDGSGERLLTSSYLEEGPTWAPNGRYIMFFREPPGGMPSLWMVEVNGRIERNVPYPGGASDPAWSPLLE
ncbi:Tol-Pal system beta propeller repeat protein TolB [Asticcacaulis sp. AC402]|uniref:Tol-Pal system beta propeller repeat protein TolB n=1 Tax=Asticcacaulis sp. AC402 TaxID=1282361 RepID=UPI0003C4020B|nr:Tol-Pal system beta propeller repeat protein TolB [Asticcacaulis sp. AC402]ESQ75545.1 translocation protein TolB [Asticcacaulis sp. AC402]